VERAITDRAATVRERVFPGYRRPLPDGRGSEGGFSHTFLGHSRADRRPERAHDAVVPRVLAPRVVVTRVVVTRVVAPRVLVPRRSGGFWPPSLARRGWGRFALDRRTPLNPPSERGEALRTDGTAARRVARPSEARLSEARPWSRGERDPVLAERTGRPPTLSAWAGHSSHAVRDPAVDPITPGYRVPTRWRQR